MSFTSGLVFYAVCWMVTFLIINPLWQKSQAEDGNVVPGTPASAPVDPMLRRKALWTTLWATCVFAILVVIIEFRLISLEDVSWATPPSLR
ncbi:DUF1467 family protein [Paralimibaculum aggregatum]|uniref:DUF1467 family protein n=1 Tax=Paralimibaculum aggregatum TaxID=3036245 RepID=A0ABQ6LE71_9RHOB|nr:DUF1467 family protein [Limibaculum sp. NKW23]GMG81649.1 DUF1467 family protein [Limibaculum sp. NKW23]